MNGYRGGGDGARLQINRLERQLDQVNKRLNGDTSDAVEAPAEVGTAYILPETIEGINASIRVVRELVNQPGGVVDMYGRRDRWQSFVSELVEPIQGPPGPAGAAGPPGPAGPTGPPGEWTGSNPVWLYPRTIVMPLVTAQYVKTIHLAEQSRYFGFIAEGDYTLGYERLETDWFDLENDEMPFIMSAFVYERFDFRDDSSAELLNAICPVQLQPIWRFLSESAGFYPQVKFVSKTTLGHNGVNVGTLHDFGIAIDGAGPDLSSAHYHNNPWTTTLTYGGYVGEAKVCFFKGEYPLTGYPRSTNLNPI